MITAFLFALTWLTAETGDYQWPLDLPKELTSSFAEYRTGRFHAGIDLRAPAGQPVHAAADGYVSRVRCSPWGYGKAVYVQFNNGNNAVYAHLSDYSGPLRDYVRKAQHAAKSYSVDLTPERGLFAVRAGDVIAKSGQTGTGAPHLHYELRNSAQQPINPRTLGVAWPDTARPILRKAMIAPQDPASRVNGDILPALLEVQPAGEGRYKTAPIRARGTIGFGVDAVDPAAGGSKLGVHRIALRQGTAEIFRLQHDVLSYDNNHNAEVSYHPYYLSEGQFLLLWRWPGNVCASYARSKGDGWWTVPESETELEIEAEDFNGNAATLIIPIRPEAEAEPQTPQGAPQGRGEADLDCPGDYLVFTARFTAPEPQAPEITVEGADDLYSPPVIRVDAKTFRAGFAPKISGPYTFHATHPRMKPFERSIYALRRGDPARDIDWGGVKLHTAPSSPYGMLFARASAVEEKPVAGLKRLGDAYRIWPADAPLDDPVTLSFPEPSVLHRPEKTHIYRKSGTGWAREDTKRAGGLLTVSARRFGTYAVMEDATPPAISGISVAEGAKASSKKPALSARISDTGSGIERAEIFCDGAWLLTAYDPEHTRMDWEADENLSAGAHKIEFRATDAAGNSTSIARSIVIP